MTDQKYDLRRAGWLYLALAIIAPFSLSYVPGVIEQADGSLAQRINDNAPLLNLSMASEMSYQIMEIFIVLLLYNYFRDANTKIARQMLILGLLPLPIVFLNELNLIGTVRLAAADPVLTGLRPSSQAFFTASLYALHGKGLIIASIFWGLWLVPLGRLVLLTGVLPKIFAYCLFLGATGYLVNATAVLILPALASENHIESLTLAASVLMIGEVPIIAGLLWAGYN